VDFDDLDLNTFFSTVKVGKVKRKRELNEKVGDAVDDFLKTVSIGKKVLKEKKSSIVGDSFDELFWSNLKKEVKTPEPSEEIEEEIEEVIEEIKEEVESKPNILLEKSLGLLSEPSDVKQQSDPLTPINQKFATLDDLQRHYKLFLERIQQQLSTLGGGGESNLTYMDVPITSVTTSSYTIKLQDYYIGVNYAGAVTITLPKADREGKIFVVKDELGEASKGTNRYITILPSGTDLIDGRDRAILAFDYGSLTFIWKGNSWRVI
jgi:hypothetical protein